MAEAILMPTLGLTMTEGTVDKWYKAVGDSVEKGEALVSISSEKLTHDVEASEDGYLIAITVEEGGEVPCQAAIGYIGAKGESVPTGEEEQTVKQPETETPKTVSETENNNPPSTRQTGERLFVTPLARRIAEEKGYELSEIVGTGGNGRITRRDVERHQPAVKAATSAPVTEVGEGLQGMRKVIAKRMHHSLQQSAQLTLHRKANISSLLTFRKEMKVKTGEQVKRSTFSLNTLLIKAISLALQDYPEMNAWYDQTTHTLHDAIHVGVAVAVEDGLVVPVIQNVQQQSLSQLGESFTTVTSQALDGTLPGDLYNGSTFTITNLGQAGIEYFTPVLNTPEVGILGIGATTSRLVLTEQKEVAEIQELPLSLTIDHQVIDGAPAAAFLGKVCDYLENPYMLLV